MPPGKIIPELVYDDLDTAAAWLCDVLGFKERLRIGNHRAQLVLEGESIIAIQNPSRTDLPANETNHSLMVRVDDVDRKFEQAVLHGARIISPPADYPYGERQVSLEDIGGHRWTLTQSIADVDPQDWGGVVVEKIG